MRSRPIPACSARLLARQFPQWAGLPAVSVSSFGTDHDIYRLGEHLAVRLPRIGWADEQAAKEGRWLLRLAPHLPWHADALLLGRPTGLRIGELRDLELDCVHQIDGHGAWLKVPLGKLGTERMVPLDEETMAVLDRIVARRTPGRPLPHPRTGRPVVFLLVHQGRRISAQALREELARACDTASLPRITPHALRHRFATGLVNAGVSLQALIQ